MTDDVLTLPDPESDTYFDELVAQIDATPGLSPEWASQWRTLAQGAATLRRGMGSSLAAIRAQIESQQAEITAGQAAAAAADTAIAAQAARWAYGSSEIAAGEAAVSVAHGLLAAPAVVLLTPTCALAGADLWHDAPDAAQFSVSTSAAAAAPISFDWLAVAPEQ